MSSDGGLPGRGTKMEAGRAETTGSVSSLAWGTQASASPPKESPPRSILGMSGSVPFENGSPQPLWDWWANCGSQHLSSGG